MHAHVVDIYTYMLLPILHSHCATGDEVLPFQVSQSVLGQIHREITTWMYTPVDISDVWDACAR